MARMASGPAPVPLPHEWRQLAAEVARQEAVPTATLLAELESLPTVQGFDFSLGWGDLVEALAEALDGLHHTPVLAAAFLRAEWEEIQHLATAMEGESPLQEAADRFQLAAQAAISPEQVRAIAASLREVAVDVRERGDLSTLQEFTWPHVPLAEGSALAAEVELAEAALPEPALPEPEMAVPHEPALPPLEPATLGIPPTAPDSTALPVTPALLLIAAPTLRRHFLERQLAFSGFSVRTADNPREAVQRLQDGRYHAVLAEPDALFADLPAWAERAGAHRLWRLVPGGALGGWGRESDVLGMPPSDEEIERLRQGL